MRTKTTLLTLAGLVACGGGGSSDFPSKYPAQKPGCEVHVFPSAPNYLTDNIGTVSAVCEESISDADCTRTLKDEACKLGADTLWGVGEPIKEYGKKKLSGRAAHQK